MWMNSGLALIFELQINPITKSDCSTAICSCRKTTFIGNLVILNNQPDGFETQTNSLVLTAAFV